MTLALLVSFVTAWCTVQSGFIDMLMTPVVFYGLLAIQLGLLFGIQYLIEKLSQGTASFLFLVYAALNGVTMSGFLLYYLTQSPTLVLVIFAVAVSLFGALSLLGYVTKYAMSGWRTFLFASVWGIFFSSLANMYFQNSLFDLVISAVALVIFSALTVYDVQYYKELHASLPSKDVQNKAATLGALQMYINFIMIFENLLSLADRAR
jgi:FtsH-binding integral membrane protein